jgi:phosphate transport system ATP-binding protein
MSEAKPEAGAKDVVFDIKDLTVRYGGAPALSDVSFQVFGNQITAIIGPSGCGKSTFIRA